MLERHPYTAQQVLKEIRTKGYTGGYSTLKEFVRLVRPVRKPAFLMLDFAAGDCAQVDWGTVLFTTAIDIVNILVAAQSAHRLKAELKKYISPNIVLVDELGYLPIDKAGADLLFQIFSQRYETGSTIVTTNQLYKHWARVFNNDATLTSAVLDRLLPHAETVTIEGKSYRMKDQIEEP
jgi:IstB-like ATP binding protein